MRSLFAPVGRRRLGAALALLVTVGVAVAIVLATQASSAPTGAAGGIQTSGTTTVQRRNLVATDTESGTVSYAHPQTVYNRLSGTITWLPSAGQVIQPGQALFKIDGDAVILMSGSTPAYRDLNGADSPGPDVLELNRNLVALGFNPDEIVVDDVWQPATTAAVELFQESLGESPTGSLPLGRVVFLPGSQVVSTVVATLGSGGGGNSAPTSSTITPAAGSSRFVSLRTTPAPPATTPEGRRYPAQKVHRPQRTHSAQKTHAATTIPALIALLRAESAQLKAESAQLKAESAQLKAESAQLKAESAQVKAAEAATRSSTRSGAPSGAGNSLSRASPSSNMAAADSGGGQASATPALQTASTQLVVTVDLDAGKQSEAKVGEKVKVEMPAGNTVRGTVTAVSPVAQSSSNNNNANSGPGGSASGSGGSGGGSGNGNGTSSATIPVTIALGAHQSSAGLDQASVSVNFVEREADNVLSVPVTALLATPGGGYAVQEAARPRQLIPVTTGLFAAGYVQISGAGIHAGLQVTDSQG